ncbi:MAG: HEAT repeat domain-containing protein [Spirochaetia bacterium]|nr:HEAT repeat domain-containing protein [Spirochaetia bacterium]
MNSIKSIMGESANSIEFLIIIGILAVLGYFLKLIISMWLIKRKIKKIMQMPVNKRNALLKKEFSDKKLLKYSKVIENIGEKYGKEIFAITGIDEMWIKRFLQKLREGDFQRVLSLPNDKGLFTCFLASLKNENLAKKFLGKFSEEKEDFIPLRRIALSGRGENFDGKSSFLMFQNKLNEIRELTGDPEWPPRYFAVKTIIHDDEKKSERALWSMFDDPYPLIRKTVVHEFVNPDREKLYHKLLNTLLKDPVYEVRKAAKDRIDKDFYDFFDLSFQKLQPEEAMHVIDLLNYSAKEYEASVFEFITNNNLELRFASAVYLSNCGTLNRLFQEVDFADKEGFERNFNILKKACEVNVTNFLSGIYASENPASLFICSRILKDSGQRELISTAAEKIFSLYKTDKKYLDIYIDILDTIFIRGGEDALNLLKKEIEQYKHNEKILKILLENIPERGDYIFVNTLLGFLKDDDFAGKDILREAIKKMPVSLIVPELLNIVKSGRDVYSHKTRIEAIKCLGNIKLDYCLQYLIENIPILPIDEARNFTKVLAEFAGKDFDKKIETYLNHNDSQIRAALIASLPAANKKQFLPLIRKALKDSDPDVRIASLWALIDFDDMKSVNQAFDMLRDPVEKVRTQASKALGMHGSKAIIKKIKEVIDDETEVETIKLEAIKGLGFSKEIESIVILTKEIIDNENLKEEIIKALSKKISKKEITELVKLFKDGEPVTRDAIAEVFKNMSEASEETISEVLKEDIKSLKPYLADILDSTGYIEEKIRLLKHRDPLKRENAANFLSQVGTLSAFRGLVMVSKDPDEMVRAQVTKALEKLNTKEGNKILQELKKDPSKKIRKYTEWALERIKVKSI